MKVISGTLILMTFVLTGCVTGTRNIDIMPPEYTNEKSVSGAIYIEAIDDKRKFEESPKSPSIPSVKGDLANISQEKLSTLVGRQRNGFGAAMGDVALLEGESIQQKVRDLLTVGLASRGYEVVDNANADTKISVDVNEFWAWFSPGFASISFESKLQCNIEFTDAAGDVSFDVSGYGINKGQVASNANWELAYQRAFTNFLEELDKILDSGGK